LSTVVPSHERKLLILLEEVLEHRLRVVELVDCIHRRRAVGHSHPSVGGVRS